MQEANRAELRDRILSDPELVLQDRDVMRALVAAAEAARGGNVVDIRGVAMNRLETRLDSLEDTHRSVIAAAYENLSGTNQIHRAVLELLAPHSFSALVETLEGPLRDSLRADSLRLVLEAHDEAEAAFPTDALCAVPAGFIADYVATPRSDRRVILRRVESTTETIYGDDTPHVGSEALLLLDLGEGRLPGMLALGSFDAQQFRATQGTDLLDFFGSCFERVMRRWLA